MSTTKNRYAIRAATWADNHGLHHGEAMYVEDRPLRDVLDSAGYEHDTVFVLNGDQLTWAHSYPFEDGSAIVVGGTAWNVTLPDDNVLSYGEKVGPRENGSDIQPSIYQLDRWCSRHT